MFPRYTRVSLLDSLRFSLFHVLPMALQGVFRKRPFWVWVVGKLHPDPLGRRFVARLRDKYHATYLDLSMLGRRTRLVLDPEGIREVLERSPDPYGVLRSKRDGMSVFQPQAVTVTGSPNWAIRRLFNDLVLSAAVNDPLDGHILTVVREEVSEIFWAKRTTFVWADVQRLFDRITLRVVFGDAAREDQATLDALNTLMSRANRVLFRRVNHRAWDTLYDAIRKAQHRADDRCLIGMGQRFLQIPTAWPGGRIPSPDEVACEGQVPHWVFAMKDTLAANTASALALLAAHPEIDRQIRAGLPVDRELTPAELHIPNRLEGCVQEAMRLWPTTPMLLREATAGGVLGGDVYGSGLQVLIWNAANHRDSYCVRDPDRFDPDRWAYPSTQWQFNHLSNGRQVCAGKRLALFLTKAVITELSRRAQLRLVHPQLPRGGPIPETFNWFRFETTIASP